MVDAAPKSCRCRTTRERLSRRVEFERAPQHVYAFGSHPRLQTRDRRIDLNPLIQVVGPGSRQIPKAEWEGIRAGAHEQFADGIVTARRLVRIAHPIGTDLINLIERWVRKIRKLVAVEAVDP